MYQRELEKILKETVPGEKKLLLHSCCAPCSSYCMEYLRQYFDVTVFYYNPNIMNEEEYRKRVAEQRRLIENYNQACEGRVNAGTDMDGVKVDVSAQEMITLRKISFVEGSYDVDRYLETIKGLEDCKEGGSRCGRCFELRLRETARVAKEMGMDKAQVVTAIEAIVEPMSLYDPVYSDSGDTIYVMDQIGDKNGDSDWIDEISIKEAVERLEEREKRILSLRFFNGKTQMEVAKEVGISQAQVSRLEKSALERIKRQI